MSVNAFRPHVIVLPEDDANGQLATGFILEVPNVRRIQVLPEAGGWLAVCEIFAKDHIVEMRKYRDRHLVLLVDFDNAPGRLDEVKAKIPEDIQQWVFILGVQSEPEALKRAGLGSYEAVGRRLGAECRDGTKNLWTHPLLQHNASELGRLEESVRSFLF